MIATSPSLPVAPKRWKRAMNDCSLSFGPPSASYDSRFVNDVSVRLPRLLPVKRKLKRNVEPIGMPRVGDPPLKVAPVRAAVSNSPNYPGVSMSSGSKS